MASPDPSQCQTPRLARELVLASVTVIGVALLFGFLFPRTRKVLIAGLMVSPIPPP
jgi:hypothetical protein